MIDITKILDSIKCYTIAVYGPIDEVFIDNLADADHITDTTLDWVNSTKKGKQAIAESSRAKVILVDESVVYSDTFQKQGKTLIVVSNPRTVIAIVSNNFFVEKIKPEIHPTAIINSEAVIGKNVYIGPYCVIGKAVIGDNCQIESHVRICDGTQIGKGCIIYDNVVLGTPGFGVERDSDGNLFRFPQLGKLILGNFVEIGPFTNIDRGALSDTIIGDYTKIDGLCKIGHNNHIGRNVVITGCASIAGSNVIEDDVWVGPNSSLKEWGHIGKNAVIGMGSVVVLKVKEDTRVFGNPARKLKID